MNNGKFITLNIRDCLENKIEGLSVADLKEALSEFSSMDPNVEAFLKNNAEDFTRQHKSVTHLVFSRITMELLGYFAITIKSITASDKMMSKTMARAFKKIGRFDEEQGTYTVVAFLIAQLGRNFTPSLKDSITGDELLEVALHLLKGIQYDIGGTIVFLESQDNDKVLSFYARNGFRALDKRLASYKDGRSYELVQLFKVL